MSVCIAHRDGWIVTDSRSSSGPLVAPTSATKAFKVGDHTLVTVAGSAVHCIYTELAVAEASIDAVPAFLSKYVYDKGGAEVGMLITNKNRQLIEICGAGSLEELDVVEYWAIGSAADRCLGYLARIGEKRTVRPRDACNAIKMAAKFDSSIDDRCQVYKL